MESKINLKRILETNFEENHEAILVRTHTKINDRIFGGIPIVSMKEQYHE